MQSKLLKKWGFYFSILVQETKTCAFPAGGSYCSLHY